MDKHSKNNKIKEKINIAKDKLLHTNILSPDHELLIWEKWIQIRKEDTAKLSQKLNREPVDLAMNLLGKVREDLERKTALVHAQVEKKPTVRGTLFESPLRLKQRCYCQPVYEVHRTSVELGHPRVIEHISVPKRIQETELGMAGNAQRNPCHGLNAGYVMYRQKREVELAPNLRKIDPFRPSTSNLCVQGTKPKIPPPKLPTPPTISVEAPSHFAKEALSDIYAIKINKTILYKEFPGQILRHVSKLQCKNWHEKCTSWSYYFNVSVKRAGRGILSLQNLGTVTLRYCWKMIKKSLPFIPTNNFEQVFFFNKNENILSPGQCRDICFTFVSDKPGIYNEHWELAFTNVCFFDTVNEKLTIDLHADSVENVDSISRKVKILEARIHKKTIFILALEILNEILELIFVDVPQIYPYKHYFLEAQMFVMKNPVYFYHQTEVAAMKEMFRKDMTPGQDWDLSISNWRKIMMSKEYDDRMKYYDALKTSHSKCLRPWYEGDELLQEKYRAVKELLGQLGDKFDKEYQRLSDVYLQKSQLEDESTECSSNEISTISIDDTQQKIRNIFFLHAYSHVADTIELCSGILSSLDSNRWIEFDFCRH